MRELAPPVPEPPTCFVSSPLYCHPSQKFQDIRTIKPSSSSEKSQDGWIRIHFSVVLFILNGAICAHHLNSINLIRQEISSQDCLSIRWTWPNSIWRESVIVALISQVSSNQKEKWKNNVNIISSYNGPVALLFQLHRALNISNVLWGKLFIHSNIGFLVCARHCLGNEDVAEVTQTKILAFMSLYNSGWWETSFHGKNREF